MAEVEKEIEVHCIRVILLHVTTTNDDERSLNWNVKATMYLSAVMESDFPVQRTFSLGKASSIQSQISTLWTDLHPFS